MQPTHTVPNLAQFCSDATLNALIHAARLEDLGEAGLDVTSALTIPPDTTCTADIHPRQPGRLAGAALLHRIAHAYDPAIQCTVIGRDGDPLSPGVPVARYAGPLRSILAMERVALNFLIHLSGIATLVQRYVHAVGHTRALIVDTRKTIPGLRGLAKYAVVCGGGSSHRIGLYDAVLVKDNHLAGAPNADLTAAIRDLIARARLLDPAPAFVEIEVDTLDQLDRVLPASPDIVLLDNMKPPQMREAVERRNRIAPRVLLEASGGVNLQTVVDIAETGVDRIAIGALTHSAPAIDLGLDIG